MTCDHSFLSLYLKSYVNHIQLTVSFSWSSFFQTTLNLLFTEKNNKGWSKLYEGCKPIIFHLLKINYWKDVLIKTSLEFILLESICILILSQMVWCKIICLYLMDLLFDHFLIQILIIYVAHQRVKNAIPIHSASILTQNFCINLQ